MATRMQPPKKVRLACQRCRARRIKCDGQVPACTNCTKAGEVCLDVDSQNSAVLIPRNFATAAQARIQWLEAIIRDRLPDVDLDAGPKVDAPPDPRISLVTAEKDPEGLVPQATKRRADSDATSHSHDAFPGQAHFIAVNLGMLSLNSESNQKHYLGSSSGRLFANLIGASPSSDGSTPPVAGDDITTSRPVPEWPGMSAAQDPLRQRYRSLHETLRRELPRKQEAQSLLQSYISWMHPDFPVLDPASLFGGLEALYSTFDCSTDEDLFPFGWPSSAGPFRWNGRLVTPQNPEKDTVPMPAVAFITFMVLNIAAIIRVRSRNYEHAPEKFYRAAMQFSQDCFSQISLPSIQALVTLVVHSMLTPAEVNLWTLLHVALAHCVELGVHREDAEESDDVHDNVSRQIRRSMFYTIYSLDRSIAAIQGRPLGFRDETFDVKMPEIAPTLAEPAPLSIHPSFSAAVIRYSTCQFELDRIVSDIKLHLYHLPGASTLFALADEPLSIQSRIDNDLKAWSRRLPSLDDPDLVGIDRRQRRIWRCELQARYHTAMVLLFQPSQMIRDPGPEQLITCFRHACAIIDIYQLLQDLQGLHYGWRAVQNIFAAGATVVYCFWMSAGVRQSAVASELTRTLRACTNLLTLGGEWWPSARKGQHGFGSVVDLTIHRLFSEQGPSKMPRLALPRTGRSSSSSGRNDGNRGSLGGTRPGLSAHEDYVAANPGDTFPSGLEENNSATAAWDEMQQYSGPWTEPTIPGGSTILDMPEFVPEVETFLADFDRSKFSWTFPLDGSSELPEFDHLSGYQF